MTLCGILVVRRRDGVLLDVNDAFAAAIGYRREELLGHTTAALGLYADPDSRPRIYRALDDGVGTTRLEVALRHRGGHLLTFLISATLLSLGGEPCVLGFFEDVTELRRIDAALRASEEELRAMFELAPVGLHQIDATTQRFVRVNAAMTALTGYSADELLRMRVQEITHPDDLARDHGLFVALQAGDRPSGQMDKRYVCKDGSVKWVQVHYASLHAAGATPRAGLAIVIDMTERRAADAQRRLLTGALQAAGNGIVITDTDGAVEWVNQAFTRLTGYTGDELAGHNLRVLRSGAQDDAFYRGLWTTVLAGERWHGELVNRHRDGHLYDEEMTITPLREDGDAITHFVAIKQDVSARKRIDEARIEAEERYRLALDAADLGTWRHDVAADRFDLDERARAHLGLGRAAVSRAEMLSTVHADDLDDVRRVIAAALDPAGTGRVSTEHRVVRPDGEVRWLSMSVRVYFTGDGAGRVPRFAIATSRDITDVRRAADALRASEDRYRGLVDNLDDLVFSTDGDGVLTFVSRSVARFGYEASDLIGHPMEDFVHPDDRAVLHGNVGARLAGDARPPHEVRWLDAEGKIRYLRTSTRPLWANGRVVGLTGLASDVTQQRETEEQLRAAQRMEAIGRLAGGVAHDFNNLLSVISSYTELALEELRPEDPLRADLGEIAQAAQRAAGLTRQLLAFSRRQILRPEAVDLGGLVSGLSNMLRRLIGEDVLLRVTADDDAGFTRVDRGQIEQVVMNLAVNARDAMPQGGELRVAVRAARLDDADAADLELPPGDYVELTMADTGCGMPPHVRARIFEPFFTTKAVGKGTGLGLSMVHGIVKQSGGGIAVDTAPGRGTSFRVLLPRLAEAPVADAERVAVPERHVLGHERVLVVEDEAGLRSVTRRLLAAAGYQVEVAANAGEALLLCEDHGEQLDLVLSDVVMPGLSGRKLAERLTSLCPNAKVVLMSGYTDEVLEPHDVLAHTFLRKPFDRAALTACVRGALDGGAAASAPRTV
ncbi:MAG TPA: PAS domain S-box protein [Kofleriaceae bacterium]|nr:PAS domain S-box protein [Kofleriaceae bacterium]